MTIRGDVGVAADGDQEWTMKLGAAIIDVVTRDVSRDVQQTRVVFFPGLANSRGSVEVYTSIARP